MAEVYRVTKNPERNLLTIKRKGNKSLFGRTKHLHLMMLPVVILLFIYGYIPMLGVYTAFTDFDIFLGVHALYKSKWVGLGNYITILSMGEPVRVLLNTLEISLWKILFGISVPIVIALMLNEVRRSYLKRSIQTIIYMPHFLSWVVLGGIVKEVFKKEGVINQFAGLFGGEPISYLQSNDYFVPIVILTNVWKDFGFQTIVFLAAIAVISPTLYESAIVDGASRWQQMKYITLPGMKPMIILTIVMSLRSILNAGFDQIFNLYSVNVYETGDIIDTFLYRLTFESTTPQYSISTAIGVFKSVIGCILIYLSNLSAKKWANYSVF